MTKRTFITSLIGVIAAPLAVARPIVAVKDDLCWEASIKMSFGNPATTEIFKAKRVPASTGCASIDSHRKNGKLLSRTWTCRASTAKQAKQQVWDFWVDSLRSGAATDTRAYSELY